MEEHQAIRQLKQGDIAGLETLVNLHYLKAVRAAYLILQDEALAEDVVQTIFLNLPQKIDQFDESREFHPWFFRSVINNAISVSRKRKRLVFVNETEAMEIWSNAVELVNQNGHNLEEDYISEELNQTIWQALQNLSPPQRAAIVLRYYLEFSEEEISQEMSQPKSAIKWTLYAARKKLRQILNPIKNDQSEAEETARNRKRR